MSGVSTIAPTTPAALNALTDAVQSARAQDPKDKARATAVDFEAVFLSNMFSEMFTSIDGEGPFGGGPGTGIWRSFLGEEYAKSFAAKGGIGIADEIYRVLIEQQAATADPATTNAKEAP
jgi:flagellar protein FlgJ